MEYISDIISVAVVNFKPKAGDKDNNFKRMRDFAIAAARQGADIVVFPELALTGSDFIIGTDIERKAKLEQSETCPGPSSLAMAEITKKYGIYVIYGMPQKSEDQPDTLYNAAVICGPEGLVGSYQKIHVSAAENTWCVRGNKPFMFETKWGPIGVGICYDTYQFPEIMRYFASKGARLYLNPTAIYKDGGSYGFREGYLKFLEARVLTNEIFIASSNLVGKDITHFFGGGSLIMGPRLTPSDLVYAYCYGGDVDCDQEGIFKATIDLSLASRSIFENNPHTGVPDYRPDLYKTFE